MSNVYAATPTNVIRADALAGVRTRRIIAVFLDLMLVSLLVMALWIVSLVLTLGLAFFFLPPLFPFVAFFYNGLTVSGFRMATPGMRAMDLEMRMNENGARVPF
ncbi:MAG TPA: RDD family protein, partial [Roseiarcus sp.]|nr:RDD family protein [Roseiarcus sp.]